MRHTVTNYLLVTSFIVGMSDVMELAGRSLHYDVMVTYTNNTAPWVFVGD